MADLPLDRGQYPFQIVVDHSVTCSSLVARRGKDTGRGRGKSRSAPQQCSTMPNHAECEIKWHEGSRQPVQRLGAWRHGPQSRPNSLHPWFGKSRKKRERVRKTPSGSHTLPNECLRCGQIGSVGQGPFFPKCETSP